MMSHHLKSEMKTFFEVKYCSSTECRYPTPWESLIVVALCIGPKGIEP